MLSQVIANRPVPEGFRDVRPKAQDESPGLVFHFTGMSRPVRPAADNLVGRVIYGENVSQ